MSIRNTQIAEELALPPVKIHCSILAEDAIKAAVEDYRNKHPEALAAAASGPAQAAQAVQADLPADRRAA
jgi:nitrogen fixation NifU-like protein